jgi:hypothetical protein
MIALPEKLTQAFNVHGEIRCPGSLAESFPKMAAVLTGCESVW